MLFASPNCKSKGLTSQIMIPLLSDYAICLVVCCLVLLKRVLVTDIKAFQVVVICATTLFVYKRYYHPVASTTATIVERH